VTTKDRFSYVGPPEIRAASKNSPPGSRISSRSEAKAFYEEHAREERGWATYVIDINGSLLAAPRRSEHVACAGGKDVLAAGELRLDSAGSAVEITNNSTGYCPREACWRAVESAFDNAGLEHPGQFTYLAVFRRCDVCGERNLVKDGWFVCAICDADLSKEWNF
jgi:hypothetical protein